MNQYTTIAGTEPSIDEQHEPRTILHEREGVTHMMSEIGEGVFVQWSTCDQCHKQIHECTCPGGPVEPGHIHRWRINRFAESFQGRGVEPALPVVLKDLDRRVNAVTRYLLARGYTIEAPETKSEIPDFNEADYDDPSESEVANADADAGDVISEKVDSGMDKALADLRARAEGDDTSVGF